MKTFKSTLLILLTVFTSNIIAQTKFAVFAGISPALYFTNDDFNDQSSSSDFKAGFYAGVNTHISMSKHFAFEPGVSFVQKGGTATDNSMNNNLKTTVTLNYIEVPLDFIYSRRNHFYFGIGPSLDFAMSGKVKISGDVIPENHDIKFGSSSEDDLKGFDAGINLLAGYHFDNGLFIATNINTGIINLSTDNSSKFYNAYWGIKLGYSFGGK